MKNFLLTHWTLLALFGVTLLIFFTNYQPNTYLTGWDNLHPEFNFWVNVKRSLFAVWQEYQGLGLLGGMGHASDLPRQLFLWLVSFLLPNSLNRYFWTFFALFLGAVGAYFLTHKLLTNSSPHSSAHSHKLAAGFAGLFYLLNLATLQTFYVPFESFVGHYAALPWLLLSGIIFVKRPTRKNTFLAILVLFLSSPAAYIPTLFVVYILSIVLVLGALLVLDKDKLALFKNSIKLGLLIFIVNAYWLLPFAYFTLTEAHVNVNSKINQMATETIFEQNREFGHVTDVVLLKGFWFNNLDPDLAGDFTFMLAPWRDHMDNFFVTSMGYVLFAVILCGIFYALKRRNPLAIAFSILFLFAFTMLATATPPFSWFDILFRKVPLFNQAFRFPFTKFSILTALTFSIFFGYGALFVLRQAQDQFKKAHAYVGASAFLLFLLVVISLPTFRGHFLYEKETIAIPNDYFNLFAHLQENHTHTRIANLPQQTFWGWNFYRWGYGGSGFLWYGIEQPILDRAFDVWSATLENYYFELSNALYSQNALRIREVLEKYQVGLVLLDRSIYYPPSPRSLFIPEIKTEFNELPSITKFATFGEVELYTVDLDSKPQNYMYFVKNPVSITPFSWGNSDSGFTEYGTYISQERNDVTYPFGTLFSLKSGKEKDFRFRETDTYMEFSQTIPVGETPRIVLPAVQDTESILPAQIRMRRSSDQVDFIARVLTPEVWVDGQKAWSDEVVYPLFSASFDELTGAKINVNGIVDIPIEEIPEGETLLETTFLTLTQDNVLYLTTSESSYGMLLPPSALSLLDILEPVEIPVQSRNATSIAVRIPKITDSYLHTHVTKFDTQNARACDTSRSDSVEFTTGLSGALSLYAKDASACYVYLLENALHEEGYALTINHRTVSGRPLHLWMLNEDQRIAPLDVFLDKHDSLTADSFVVHPMQDNGRAYSLHMENISIGPFETENEIASIEASHIPYRFLTGVRLENKPDLQASELLPDLTQEANVRHPNESLYTLTAPASTGTDKVVLVLSQSYNPGWKAYQVEPGSGKIGNFMKQVFPFLFGDELEAHVKVNNWSNGWILPSQAQTDNYSLIVVYLPQYLEYAGFVILIIYVAFLAFKKGKKRSHESQTGHLTSSS